MANVHEVKKALDACIHAEITSECNGCVYREYEGGFCIDALMKDALDVINQMEVVRGRWENVTGGMVTLGDCSECKVRQPVFGTNYCKHCGAKMMDGERKNNENECNT